MKVVWGCLAVVTTLAGADSSGSSQVHLYAEVVSATDVVLAASFSAAPQRASDAKPADAWTIPVGGWHWQHPALLCLSVVLAIVGLLLLGPQAGTRREWDAAYMIVYIAFGVTEYILVRVISARHDGLPFAPVAGVVCIEASKLVVSLGLISYAGTWRRFGEVNRWDAMLLLVPAVLYLVLNSLFYIAVSNVTVASYAIVFEMQIIFVALLWMLVFGRWLSAARAVACVGIVIGALTHNAGEAAGISFRIGIWLPTFVALWAAICTITCEKVFKAGGSLDINVQNSFLYTYGILFGISLLFAASHFSPKYANIDFFAGIHHPEVVALLSIRACHGIAASRILKYIDSVSKTIGAALTGPLAIGFAPFFVDERVNTYTFVAVIITYTSSFFFWKDPGSVWKMFTPRSKKEEDHPA